MNQSKLTHRLSILTWVALLALWSIAAFGQDYRARIQGTVTDSSNAAIVGAKVTMLNTKTGVESSRETSETGHYLFDLVEPGEYNITVENAGFSKFVQEKVGVLSRADVTVDVQLTPGAIVETVTVTAEVAALQFNTAKLETTVDQKLTQSLPQLYRNVFLLAQLDPSVQSTSWGEDNPYDTWASNNLRIGGSGQFTNDLQVDGSASGISVKTGYVPSPDMVQEVNVLQNAVDAEYGHSSGSAISVVLKSGTNEFHGNAFFQGQRPYWNALENRVYRSENQTRNNMWGATLGGPILKNKLFNFVGFEMWTKTEPAMLYNTVPTDLERAGNFSQSITGDGDMRPIFDPWSTQTAADGTITRTPFAGNMIPNSRMNAVALKYIGALWKPNGPGIDAYHTNNFVVSTPIKYPYKNFSDRADYVVNDKLRVYGRASITRTPVQVTGNPTGSPMFMSDRGADYNMTSYAGDATYALNATTVLNFHGGYHNFRDTSHFATEFAPEWSWEGVFPNQNFYAPVFADPGIPKLIPRMSVCNIEYSCTHMGPGGGLWHETPHAYEFTGKIAQQRGAHYLKAGADVRRSTTDSLILLVNPGFGFDANPTSATYNNPDLLTSGDPYATYLLGAIVPTDIAGWGSNGNAWDSGATGFPVNIKPKVESRFYGFYLNDDWKVSRKLTLNLGLRYERESPFQDALHRETRALDLNAPIPELQSLAMPAEVKQFYNGSWKMNGAFQFASEDNPGSWNGGKGTLSPRIGAAYRLNDKTVLRAAYGRYVTPWTTNSSHDQLSGFPIYGFSNFTGAPDAIQGVPQMSMDNPFPASNPVAPAYGKSLGMYTMLGESIFYFDPNRRRSNSDRVNVSVQRQLPGSMVLDVTYFLNRTGQLFHNDYNINQVDPRIAYTYKEQTLAVVPNPFYDLLPVEKFPGQLRYQTDVDVLSLARPYPHYGDITVVDGREAGSMKYQALQIKLQKNYSHGVSMLLGYSYNVEKDQRFFDSIANYDHVFSWQEPNGSYRQRFTAAGSWDLPFGKGRPYLSHAPYVLDAIVGGWRFSPVILWRGGNLLGFGAMVWDGTDPKVDDPTPQHWFNSAAFKRLPDFTPRTNPWNFAGLRGPGVFSMNASFAKDFAVIERLRMQLRADAFNLFNNMSWGDPSTSVTSGNFGKITNQANLTYGRRVQLGLRLEF
ncbi:MAG: TonB-dependent receptor [Bryobacteraceae bacterium]|nr:TonB-dependent receptor [Bryobacteraceae bacterium]